MVLVAPAPPTPMAVPEAQRKNMLASYKSREGVLQALNFLAGPSLTEKWREQVIEDTLRGDPPAKRIWPAQGMIDDISTGLDEVTIPVNIVVGDCDQVEKESSLREAFDQLLPQTNYRVLKGIGHLSPLEAPDKIAQACTAMLVKLELS